MLHQSPGGAVVALQNLVQVFAFAAQHGQPAPLGLDQAGLQQIADMLQVPPPLLLSIFFHLSPWLLG